MPTLALAVKCVSLARIAGTLVETYLGRDAGRRVLNGLIRRGVAEQISAVLWYSDLREFTRITDRAEPEQIIPLLNDYAGAAISAIYDNGGDVLKLIGDGILAIFTADIPEASLPPRARGAYGAAGAARRAERAARGRKPAGHRNLSRPAYRRRVLRQYRQRRTARLHGGGPGGQRGRPHRRDVPLGGPRPS